jgi:hypothetical protein
VAEIDKGCGSCRCVVGAVRRGAVGPPARRFPRPVDGSIAAVLAADVGIVRASLATSEAGWHSLPLTYHLPAEEVVGVLDTAQADILPGAGGEICVLQCRQISARLKSEHA